MNKQRQSKLDAHAERLTEWFTPVDKGGKGYTLDQAREQLRLDGVQVSCSALSDWWSRRQSSLLQERLLMQIANGSRQVKEVEAEFAKNPAPGMEAIANLHKLLAFQLASQGAANPELIELSTKCTKMVLDYAKVGQKKEELSLSRQKFEFDAAKACLDKLPELKAIASDKGLNETERVEQIRLRLFGVLPETT